MSPLLFTEPAFLFGFAPIVLSLYFLLPAGWRNGFLLFASLALYTWAEGLSVLALLACVIVTYVCGVAMARMQNRARLVLTVGIAGNVLLLGVLKYSGFVLQMI